MTKHRHYKFALFTGVVLALAGVILAQSETASTPAQTPGTPQGTTKTLIVNGKSSGAVVREIDGHTYIEIEALARATNGIVTIEATRVLLTIPVGSTVVTSAAGVPPNVAPTPVERGLSVDFKRAAIAELSEMREWRGAIGAMITYGLAASDQTASDYHDRCEDGLNQASVSVATDADGRAMQLLKNQFTNMTAWANQILAERKALNGARTVSPSAQQNDRALQNITACGRFLNTMIVSGNSADDASCH
jgi:hypothetical protein